MFATLVIGLREGLEAALIVGIIAAFLRSNGKRLTAMWLGVALAIALSIAVGVGLAALEHALPQTAQEALETVIGFVAVFFVSGMIVWMHAHARDMKRQLEGEAARALGRSSALALAAMAFLAVLKEGFETSVFLLATFSVAQSATWAAVGAVTGLVIAAGLGWGIYAGGLKLNLSRFFRITAVFLVLVAAGLVLSSLRTAHEAGWLNAGQYTVLNLDGLVAPGTVQSALVTGVLGIPADPRLVEVLGWLVYLVPMLAYLYWPRARRPGRRGTARLQAGCAAAAILMALGLAFGYPRPQVQFPAQAPLVTTDSTGPQATATAWVSGTHGVGPATLHIHRHDTTATLVLADNQGHAQRHAGTDARTWKITRTTTPANAPSSLTLAQVVALAGGRIPIGLDPRRHPGPFAAHWSTHHATRAWLVHGTLLDATGRRVTTVTLSGSGLDGTRTLVVHDGAQASAGWHVSPAYTNQLAAALDDVAAARVERQLWAVRVPIGLLLGALALLFFAWRNFRQSSRPTQLEPVRETARLPATSQP